MRWTALVPRTMVARLSLVLLAALAVEFAGNSLLYKWQERGLLTNEKTRAIAERLVSAQQIAIHARPDDRARLMADMTTPEMTLNWVPATIITDFSDSYDSLRRMRARLDEMAPSLAGQQIRLNLMPADGGSRDLLGALRLADGSFVSFRIRPFLGAPLPFTLIATLHLMLIAGVACVALIMMRAMVRPLSDLAGIADATGRGATPEIRIEGPHEVQRVATAFDAMQSRLLDMIEEHTQALLAVSHDLRTPIQRLHLRTALLDDEETRNAMTADLTDMERFVGSVVDFMQNGTGETDRPVDLAAIAMTIADNACDLGADVDYAGPDSLPIRLKPLALKRALANLVDNAVHHAAHVRISVEPGNPVRVRVDDDGPGIPPSEREAAFLPFQRLANQPSHADPEHKGAGLGLAIVRKAVATLDGTVMLDDSPMGGLAVTITLPFRRTDPTRG